MADVRRSLGQYRRMIKDEQAMLRYVWVHWAIPIPLVGLSFYLGWHWFWKMTCIFALIAGIMSHADTNARIWLYKKKVRELEELAKL